MSDFDHQSIDANTAVFKEKIESIRTSTLEVSKGQNDLVHQVESVVEILEKISEVAKSVANMAEETQLISVNASIEAARSGADGKTFSVIAQEIKSLANESKNTVKHIETYTIDINKSVQEVLAVLRHSSEKLNEQVSEVDNITGIAEEILSNSSMS